MVAYLRRAAARVRDRGILNTAIYSGHVARKAALSAYVDVRYLGRLSRDRHHQEIPGVRPTMHSDVLVLDALFSEHARIGPDDVLVDVGCGEGRVIAYWLSRGLRNPMFGIEINHRAAALAASHLRRWRNVTILEGDAAELAPASGTLFYLFNTLPREPLARLEAKVRAIPRARVLIYNFLEDDLAPFLTDDWCRETFTDTTHWRQYRAVLFTRR